MNSMTELTFDEIGAVSGATLCDIVFTFGGAIAVGFLASLATAETPYSQSAARLGAGFGGLAGFAVANYVCGASGWTSGYDLPCMDTPQ